MPTHLRFARLAGRHASMARRFGAAFTACPDNGFLEMGRYHAAEAVIFHALARTIAARR